jgi:vancomycin resistance protein YoaR
MIMRNKYLITLIAAIISILLISCSTSGSRNQSEKQSPPSTSHQEAPKVEVPKPQISGETAEVPWADDNRFKDAMEKNDTSILMGAYQTVLKDPLPGEESNVHLAAKILSGAIVNPGEIFSQNERIGPYSESRGFQKGPTYNGSKLSTTIGGGVCKIASTLYNAAILSNLPIVERHPHGMPVPYVPYGQDATVSYGKIDF